MKVHVVVASKHGSTAEIAGAIGDTLRDRHLEVAVHELVDHGHAELDLDDDDAVVIGSAIYAGEWLRHARRFVHDHADELEGHPTWLFSSGPLGDGPSQPIDPVSFAHLQERTHAVGHRIFTGKLDRSDLGFAERALAAAVRAPEGDFRDWSAITSWATSIADSLDAPV